MSERHLRRVAAAAGTLAGVAGLAGCASSDDSSGTPASEGTSPTDGPTPAAESGGDSTPSDPETVGGPGGEASCLDLEMALVERAEKAAIRGELPDGHPEDRIDAARTAGEAIRESVVVVEAGFGQGTGWYATEDLVVTNAHNVAPVIESGRESDVGVHTFDGRRSDVEVLAYEESMQPDVALLRVDAAGPPLSMADGVDLAPETPLVQVGHPGGVGHWVVSLGLFVEVQNDDEAFAGTPPDGGAESPPPGEGDFEDTDFEGGDFEVTPTIRCSVPGRQGNSGSPLCTLSGTVVGMTNASEQRGQTGDGVPRPDEPVVYDWPIAPRAWTVGDTIDVIRDRLDL